MGEQALRGEGHTLVGGGLGKLVLIYSLSRKTFIFIFFKIGLETPRIAIRGQSLGRGIGTEGRKWSRGHKHGAEEI